MLNFFFLEIIIYKDKILVKKTIESFKNIYQVGLDTFRHKTINYIIWFDTTHLLNQNK
jgi:hypothetical protein